MSTTNKPSRSSLRDANDEEELVPLTSPFADDVFDDETPTADEMEKCDKDGIFDSLNQNLGKSHTTENKKKPDKSKPEVTQSMSMEEQEIRCGFGRYKPDALQKFNNPKCLLACLSFFAFIQGFVVNGINNVNTTTIERRFGMPSSEVGSISSAYDVSAAILGVIISYFGAGRNKSKYVSLAAGCMAIGSFVMTLPHFTTGLYHWGQHIGETCSETDSTHACPVDATLHNYLYVFLLGQALHGVGGTTLYIVGVALMDDSVPAKSSPLYIGIFYAFATFGPAVGYIVGGQMLTIYVDFNEPESNSGDLTQVDPRWVGAWWVGFLVASFIMVSVAIPLAAFGVELPSAKYVRDTRVSQTHKDTLGKCKDREDEIGNSIRDLPRSFWVLVTNPVFMFITLAGAAEGLSTSGFATFMPKFIQNQFGTTASWSAILTGIVAVPGAAGGQFVSGLLCKRLNLKVKGMLRFVIIAAMSAGILDAAVWIRCQQATISGVTTQYSQSFPEEIPNLQSHSCNANCSCSSEFYTPVCSDQKVQYFSPCHAGCRESNANKTQYTNCTCLSQYEGYSADNHTLTVTKGKCTGTCNLLFLFLPAVLLAIFCRFMQSPPALSVTLRCIHDRQRTFALGIQWFVVRLLGTVPGPIMFGSIVDSTCLVWQEKCGEQKSCWIYDNLLLSRNFFIILFCVKIVTCCLMICAYKCYKPPVDSVTSTTKNGEKAENIIPDDQSTSNCSDVTQRSITTEV